MPDSIPKQIVLNGRQDVDFWCRYFGCTPKDLQEALDKMGSCTAEVRLYLKEMPGKKGLSFWWEFMK